MKRLHRHFALGFSILFSASSSAVLAAPVTFWFGGRIDVVNDDSKALPFPVTVGMPFTGRVLYDPALVSSTGSSSFPGGSSGQYYFETAAGFTMQLLVGGHVLVNSDAPLGSQTGEIFVGDNSNNEDELYFSVGTGGGTRLDGQPMAELPRFVSLDLNLADASKTALTDNLLPAALPDLARYAGLREMIWQLAIDDGGPTRIYSVSGQVTTISSQEIVFLTQAKTGPDTLRLSWPASNPGFTLQSCTNLTLGNWQDVAAPVTQSALEYSVTVKSSAASQFFRLRK